MDNIWFFVQFQIIYFINFILLMYFSFVKIIWFIYFEFTGHAILLVYEPIYIMGMILLCLIDATIKWADFFIAEQVSFFDCNQID